MIKVRMAAAVLIGCMTMPKLWADVQEVRNLTSVGVGDKVTLTWEPGTVGTTYNVYSVGYYLQRYERLNDEPLTDGCFTFDYPVDEGDMQYKVNFIVTCVTDGVESEGVMTGVVVGEPYRLPLDYDFEDFWYWETSPISGKIYQVWKEVDAYWEGENVSFEGNIMLLAGRHAEYTFGKTEVMPNTYLQLKYQKYDQIWYFEGDYLPEQTLDVYAIDPYGQATLLNDDGSGRGYSLAAVADNPWVRIRLVVNCDYDEDLWKEHNKGGGVPFVLFRGLGMNRIAEMDRITDVVIDGVCYRVNQDLGYAMVINPELMDGVEAYCGEMHVRAVVELDGVSYPVTELADDALKGCEAVTTLELPASLKVKENCLLEDMDSLTSLFLHYTDPVAVCDAELGYDLSLDLGYRCTLYVPVGTLECYRSVAPWAYFTRVCEYDYETGKVVSTDERVITLQGVNVDDNLVFDLDNVLHAAELRAAQCEPYSGTLMVPVCFEYEGVTYTVTSINEDALKGCGELRALTLPSGVRIKDASPFVDCHSLRDIRLGAVPPTFVADKIGPCAARDNAVLYVPMGCRDKYKRDKVWWWFEQPIVEVDEEGNEYAETGSGYDPEVRNLTAVGMDGKVTLTWEADAEAAAFNIYSLDDKRQRKAQLNDAPVTTGSFSFAHPVDEGDGQHKDLFMVTRVTEGSESVGAVTGVVMGAPYKLPFNYNFTSWSHWEQGAWSGHEYWVEVPDWTYWEGKDVGLNWEYGRTDEKKWLWMGGHHAYYTIGKMEVKPNTYLQLEHRTYQNAFSVWGSYDPMPTFEVYAIDPYGQATLLTEDESGQGYPLDAVADNPWVRIRIEKTCDYDDGIWDKTYYIKELFGSPDLYIDYFRMTQIAGQGEAIEEIEDDAVAVPMLYTLDGKPVHHPYPGIFVVKR